MLEPGMQVEVYRNIRDDVWSIRHAHAKLIVGHASRLVLTNCEFRVSQSGRLRVLANKRKNVHASIKGTIVAWEPVGATLPPLERPSEAVGVTYNPYKNEQFVTVDGDVPVLRASRVWLDEDMKVYAVPSVPPEQFRYRTHFEDGTLYGTLRLNREATVGTRLWLDTGFVFAFLEKLPYGSSRAHKVYEVEVTGVQALPETRDLQMIVRRV